MPFFRNLFFTKKVYFVILFVFIVLVLAITMIYKYGVLPSFFGLNKPSLVKIIPATYVDQKYNFSLIYPSNKFTFKTQTASFFIPDEARGEVNVVEISKGTPFSIVILPTSTIPTEYFLTVNPIDLFVSVLTGESISKGLKTLVEEEKKSCTTSYKGKSGSECDIEQITASDGRPIYTIKGWANNSSGNVMENIYVPNDNFVLKFNFIYSEAALKIKNPDAILRQNIITYIISNSFKVNFK